MKKIILTITDPCSEDWNAMHPADKGRFCRHCQKTVIDFTGMTDARLTQFIRSSPAGVCGRFYTDQLNREISITARTFSFPKYFFVAAIPAFMLSFKAAAQKKIHRISVTVVNPLLKGEVANFTAQAKDTPALPASKPTIPAEDEVQKPNTACAQTDEVDNSKIKAMDTVFIKTYPTVKMGKIVAGSVAVISKVEVKADPVKDKPIRPEIPAFQIYPNPVGREASCWINTANMEKGTYQLSLLSIDGRIINRKAVEIDNKNKMIALQVDNVAAGAAYVQLLEVANGKQFVQKIIIE